MGIFTTTYNGGKLKRLPVKTKHGNIIRQLRGKRKRLRNGDIATHVKLTEFRLPYLVYSCFFINEKNLRITKVWDATRGFRKLQRGFKVPKEIFDQIK